MTTDPATRDRRQQAELVVAVARTEAVSLIVTGRSDDARRVLDRAVRSANRILGGAL